MSVQNHLQKIVVLCVVVIVVGILAFMYAPSEQLECFKKNHWGEFEDVGWKIDGAGKCVEYSTMPHPFDVQIISEDKETGEIVFMGTFLPGGSASCYRDGVCSTIVGGIEVIWAIGDSPGPIGSMDDVINLGDELEVYGEREGEGAVTIYGNEEYYIKNLSLDSEEYVIYMTYLGYTTKEAYDAWVKNEKKICVGRSEPILDYPLIADAPAYAKCYGYLENTMGY